MDYPFKSLFFKKIGLHSILVVRPMLNPFTFILRSTYKLKRLFFKKWSTSCKQVWFLLWEIRPPQQIVAQVGINKILW